MVDYKNIENNLNENPFCAPKAKRMRGKQR